MNKLNFDNLIFYTINPHYKEYSINKLVHNFKHTLKTYYKNTLGPRYHKHKDKQLNIYIFPEETTNEIKEPHLHIIIEIDKPKRETFFEFMNNELVKMYPSLTYDIQQVINTETDKTKLLAYCNKEDKQILGKEDLW
ncbi:MAG: hypothetical protein R3Y43_08400 [Alphaproteobacteria bacterium]